MPRLILAFSLSMILAAHPMGNFSVNHYTRIQVHAGEVRLTYVLDLAEIPTFELINQWQSDVQDLKKVREKSAEQAPLWIRGLTLAAGGRPLPLEILEVSPLLQDGAGGLPVLRVEVKARAILRAAEGVLTFEDSNYAGRAGWKEIVLDHDAKTAFRNATHGSNDQSAALTSYPSDPAITPPQDLTARIEWARIAAVPDRRTVSGQHVNQADATPSAPATGVAGSSFSAQQATGPGTVVAGDFLSRLIRQRDIDLSVILLALAAALGLGAVHALSPGHGKTIVAAYLVGTRGTWRHAAFLGAMVTFTHTASVFLLGLGVLCFERYVVPDRVIPVLGVVSGLSIVSVGALLLYRRARALMHDHHHSHSHHHHALDHSAHVHSHGGHTHSHDGHTHTHLPEDKVTAGTLIALAVSGGLVPCPSALVLMLSAIAMGHPGLGLILLVAFSSGLALVLTGIGLMVVYARNLLPAGAALTKRPLHRLIPVFSAVVVICLGCAMTAASAGWIPALRFLS